MNLRRALAFFCVLLLGGCGKDYPNPFANASQTFVPPAGAALVFTSNAYAPQPGAPREIFAVNEDGSSVTRLTLCNGDPSRCDSAEAAPAPDRRRMAVRRATGDPNVTALFYLDLQRAVDAQLVPGTKAVSGIDWSPAGEVLVYSALGDTRSEDLFRADPNGQNTRPLTCLPAASPAPGGVPAPNPPCEPGMSERRPRIDPTGSVAVFERIGASGKGEVWIFNNTLSLVQVTAGGAGSDPLSGTPYVVGSDADPDYSPDGRSIVFRRLTGLGNGGLGTWDILTVTTDGTNQAVVATGPIFRGAPDWGQRGIAFTEVDSTTGTARLVTVQPDGSGRRVLVSAGSAFSLGYPRWLAP